VFAHQEERRLLLRLGLAHQGSRDVAGASTRAHVPDPWPADSHTHGCENTDEGIFSVVSYNADTEELVAFTDRTGMWGLYLAEDESGIWLSSSSLAIGCLRSVSLDDAALGAMRAAGYLLGDISLFREVKRLDAGERLVMNRSGMRVTRWWTPPEIRLDADVKAETTNFVESVTHRLGTVVGGRCALTTLTAGLDSRCLMALVRGAGLDSRFFTAASESPEDIEVAQRIARELGLNWFELAPTGIDAEGFRTVITLSTLLCDGENQPFRGTTYWAAALADLEVPVIWGFGGEAFRRYWSKQEQARMILKGASPLERLVRYRMAAWSVPPEVLESPLAQNPEDVACELLGRDYDFFATRSVDERLEAMYLSERIRRWASAHLKTMAWWIEPELPFIGQKLVEQAYGLPMAVREGAQLFRGAIWQCMPDAGRIPHNEGYHTLPYGEASFRDRLRTIRLDSAKLVRKIWPSRTVGHPYPPAGVSVTYRKCFEDELDPSRMISRFLYREKVLRDRLRPLLDEPAGTVKMVNEVLGLEIALRAVTMLRT